MAEDRTTPAPPGIPQDAIRIRPKKPSPWSTMKIGDTFLIPYPDIPPSRKHRTRIENNFISARYFILGTISAVRRHHHITLAGWQDDQGVWFQRLE